MRVSVLCSGSSGNSTFLQSRDTSILIDCGISLRRLKNALQHFGKTVEELDGVLISHEHTDHVSGLDHLARRGVPVFMNRETKRALGYNGRVRYFRQNATFMLNDLLVNAIPLSHDAANPSGFRIKYADKVVGIATDFGNITEAIIQLVRESHCLVLESNHDIDMLINGPYPYHLKQRILGEKGHISNIDSSLLVKTHGQNLQHVFLAHLSRKNNTTELAEETFCSLVPNVSPIIADQKQMTRAVIVD